MRAFVPVVLLLAGACAPSPDPVPATVISAVSDGVVRPGIEMFIADVPARVRGKRVGLITNQSGIDRSRNTDIDLIAASKDVKLVALLAPEHGIRGTIEAGEKVGDERDARTGLPI